MRDTLGRPRRRRWWRTATALGVTLAVPLTSVAVSLAAVRVGGVETWGAFVGLMILVQLTAQGVDLGSRDALLRAFSGEPARSPEAWRRAAGSRLMLLPLGPGVLLVLVGDPGLVAMGSVWFVALVVARLHEAVVAFRRAFGFALVVELVAAAIVLGGVLGSGDGLDVARLASLFMLAAVVRVALLAARFPMLRRGPGWAMDARELRRSWPFFGLSFSGAVQSRIDLYIVAALLPAVQVGTYQVLVAFVLLIQSAAGALVGPIVPALYRLPRSGVLAGARRLGLVGLALGSAGMAGAWIVMASVYDLDVPLVTVACAWVAVLPVWWYSALIHLAYREGDERFVLVTTVLGLSVSAVGSVLTAGRMGITGPMASAAAAQVLMLACHRARAGGWARGWARGRAP